MRVSIFNKILPVCTAVIMCSACGNGERVGKSFKLAKIDITDAKAIYSTCMEDVATRGGETESTGGTRVFKIDFNGNTNEIIIKDGDGNSIEPINLRFFNANSKYVALNFDLSSPYFKRFEYFINRDTGRCIEIPQELHLNYDYIRYIPSYDKNDNIYISSFTHKSGVQIKELNKLTIDGDVISYHKISGDRNVNKYVVDWNGDVFFTEYEDSYKYPLLFWVGPDGNIKNIPSSDILDESQLEFEVYEINAMHAFNYMATVRNDEAGGIYYSGKDGLMWGRMTDGNFVAENTGIPVGFGGHMFYEDHRTISVGSQHLFVINGSRDIQAFEVHTQSETDYGIHVTANYAYWVNVHDDGSIARASLNDGTVEVLFSEPGYWLSRYPGVLHSDIFVSADDAVYFKATKTNGDKIHGKIKDGVFSEEPDNGEFMAGFIYN